MMRRYVEPASDGPLTLVVGGTYVDRVSMVSAEIIAGRTIEIESSAEALGGPGLCLAVALRRLGMNVVLATALGSCASSRLAAQTLRSNDVTVLGEPANAQLDRSDLYVAPSGQRIVFNTHALSRSAPYREYAQVVLGRAAVIVIGSPTPLGEAERIVTGAGPETLLVALLHSGQIAELAAGKTGILRALDVVCVADSDEPLLRDYFPGGGPALVVTLGADGARLRSGFGVEVAVPQPDVVETRNTNGAGEAFCAALTAVLAQRRGTAGGRRPAVSQLRDAVETAHGYAAAHLRAGGNINFPPGTLADFAKPPAPATVAW